jgi:glycosyltransferase involved in cell wall biosynthesis
VALNPHPIYDWFNMGHYSRDGSRRELDLHGRVLLFFGLVRRYKGLDILLRAFARIAQQLDATLLVVGEFYEDRGPYDRLINELGIGERVRVTDRYVANEEVEKYFKACDLVVLPYREATQSGIVQTAYSFEKPVVVTRVGGLPDVVTDGKTGYVVEPDDPEALASARVFARISTVFRGDTAWIRSCGWARPKTETVQNGQFTPDGACVTMR